MRQGYLGAGFLAGMAVSLSLWNSLQAQEQNQPPAPSVPVDEPDELPYVPPPPPPTTSVAPRSASVPVSASSSAATIILPAPQVPDSAAAPTKRRLPLWTTSSKQEGVVSTPPAALVGNPPVTPESVPASEPLFGTTPLPGTANRPAAIPPLPARPRAGQVDPISPSSTLTSGTLVDVYIGVKQLESGKPQLTGVVIGDNVEFGGKKFLKLVRPENPQEYWLLDAKVVIAAQFKR